MKFKVIIIMLTTMLFMGCDIFGPSCEDLQAELIAAGDTFMASYTASILSGTSDGAADECDTYVAKMQEYSDKGCGDEEGGAPIDASDIALIQAMCTALEVMEEAVAEEG